MGFGREELDCSGCLRLWVIVFSLTRRLGWILSGLEFGGVLDRLSCAFAPTLWIVMSSCFISCCTMALNLAKHAVASRSVLSQVIPSPGDWIKEARGGCDRRV